MQIHEHGGPHPTSMGGVGASRAVRGWAFPLSALFIVVLPNLEVPKNLLLATYLVLGLWQVVVSRFQWRKLDPYAWAWIALLAVAVASSWSNHPYANQLKGIKEGVGLLVVALWIYYAGFTARQRAWIIVLGIFATWAGLLYGLNAVVHSEDPTLRLELHSAGIVTQSSMYVGTVLIAALAMGRALGVIWPSTAPKFWIPVIQIAVIASLAAGLVLMGSRGAILATGVAALLWMLLNIRRVDRRVVVLAVPTIAVMGIAITMLSPMIDNADPLGKMARQLSAGQLDDNDGLRFRDQYYGLYLYQHAGKPLLGVGPRNFWFDRSVPVPDTILDKDPHFQVPPHPHNLFITKLAEEGALGLFAMLWLFGWVAYRLWKRRSESETPEWSACLGALVVPIVAGSFNSPWIQEPALLAAVLFSLFLSVGRSAPIGTQGERDPAR